MPLTVEIADSAKPCLLTKVEPLGKGYHGEVYLCLEEDGSQIAVKVIPKTHKLISEETILPRLDHPNIVSCKATEEGNFILLKMPVLEQTLEKMIHERKNSEEHWSWSIAINPFGLYLLQNIVSALAYLFKFGCVHGDIKPNNIMVHKRKPVIIDFGCVMEDHEGTADVQGVALLGIFILWFKERKDLQKEAMLHFAESVKPEPDDLFGQDLVLQDMLESYEMASKVLKGCTVDFHNILKASFLLKVNINGETKPFSIRLLFNKLKKCTKLIDDT